MATMRLYSKDQLEKALNKLGWHKTDSISKTTVYWETDTGKKLTVPNPDPLSNMYSDFIFDDILSSAIKLSDLDK